MLFKTLEVALDSRSRNRDVTPAVAGQKNLHWFSILKTQGGGPAGKLSGFDTKPYHMVAKESERARF